jgi:1-acyl-sn-glycerol-3-phosphate acyltransferase
LKHRGAEFEPRSVRWKRRAVTIPTMLAATFVAVAGLPILAPLFVVADLARARWRLPSVRVYLFVTQYAINDTVEILLAPWYWILAGFGTRIDVRSSIRRHQRIQEWSVALLARRAEQLLGVRVEIDDRSRQALAPAPAIVLCRHVNLLDASLPTLLYQWIGIQVRGVIMAELLADPGLDLLYRRLGSIFIPRDNAPEARSKIRQLGTTLDDSTVAVIFPEGRLYRPELLAHVQAKLAHSDPGRARHLEGLRNVLPIRPGGVSALLDAAPEADVVVIAHTGLDRYPDFRSLARCVPLTTPLQVAAWRIARETVPSDPTERHHWLDNTWQAVDDWIDTHKRA